MTTSLRDDFQDLLVDYLTRERRLATRQGGLELEVLSAPHPMSPFLTLAEWWTGDGLPSRVLKLLTVLPEDPSAAFWRDVLERERERWLAELERRLATSSRVGVLELPLSWNGQGPAGLVEMTELGPLRRRDLLVDHADGNVQLPCLIRPYVAWPRLGDVGFSADQLRERWEMYCRQNEVAEHLVEPLFPHFCDEALMAGQGDVLLTSAWRLEVFR